MTKDELELQISALEDSPNESSLHTLFRALCEYFNLNQAKPQSTVLDIGNSSTIKKYIGSTILRLLEKCSDLFWSDGQLRLKTILLLDDCYADSLYKIQKLDPKAEGHIKFSSLQSVSSEVTADFEKLRSSITSIETAIKSKQAYIKLLSNPRTIIFTENQIQPPSISSKERAAEFFSSLESYCGAERIHKLDAYENLRNLFLAYELDLSKHNENRYSKTIIKEIIFLTYNLAKIDFETSEIQTPAKLTIEETKRKYPLHTCDQQFQIKLIVANDGPGFAFETRINIIAADPPIELETHELNIGTIDTGKHEFIINANSKSATTEPPIILGLISWSDYKGDRKEIDFEIKITPQNGTLDWEKIKYLQPYSLESVDTEAELIGRKDLLENISSKLSLKKSESSIIHGQKRVGKTSLARTIQKRFEEKENYITIFIETGSLDKSTPANFIKSLGEKIIKKLRLELQNLSIQPPSIVESLYPLVSFLEDLLSLNNSIRIIIILDEFDEIPSKLYPYTEAGNSFFHNLRSISGESGEGRVALILVGGENMSTIMQSTDKLNKFDAYNVGYFDKSRYWEDFKELLTAPLQGVMEFSDEAILSLYETTEGNPFYTKFIAKNLYRKMCDKRCSFISADEMNDAIRDAIASIETINVNHFWSDGIRVEDSERRDQIETQRRRFLIRFSEKMRSQRSVCKEELISDNLLSTLPVAELIESFISRNILINENNEIRIKPRLFEKWLLEKGIHSLRASFADEDAISAFEEKDSKHYVTDLEIIDTCKKWELYRGAEITATSVRAWLEQFENNQEKRSVFTLLSNIKFYGELLIREKLSIIHETIRRRLIHQLKQGERLRKDIIISCFGTADKSGSSYVRMYASENGITSHNVKSISEIKKTISNDNSIQAIVFIDDIVATGDTIKTALDNLNSECGEILKERNILVVVGVICGLSSGLTKLEEFTTSGVLKFETIVHSSDILAESDKAFSTSACYFSSMGELMFAKATARKYGAILQNRHPLGYGDSELLVVFKDNCPNNTLPIFWASSQNWTPLFKRG
ncbi:ATP-binding protein [Pseudomonas citronellolis]|uniref:phosphoribosyltransferase-like protein n=1 Tax=Pseudomonas citronellolis TaxID=53408 RepID=UPI0021129FAA|nr:ATP-binding protein [Pseudomonas citronellolis]UUC48220.1 ATP-binding protein [Pseudomonas citronellolis]